MTLGRVLGCGLAAHGIALGCGGDAAAPTDSGAGEGASETAPDAAGIAPAETTTPDTPPSDAPEVDTRASIFAKHFVLAFHTCKTDCGNPQNHVTHLAESDDLLHWTAVSAVASYKGSVPDLVVRDSTVYVYNPQALHRFDQATGAAVGASTAVEIRDSAGAHVDFVDPSPTLLPDGRIALFFLDSTGSHTDPARCPTNDPCTKVFRSATEDPGSDGGAFTLDPGERFSIALTGSDSASDPDIFKGSDADGWVIAVSRGGSTDLYTSPTLTGSYTSVVHLAQGGGVPAGYFDGAEYWQFGTHFQGGVNEIDVRHAPTLEGLATAVLAGAITSASLGLEAGLNVESPGIFER